MPTAVKYGLTYVLDDIYLEKNNLWSEEKEKTMLAEHAKTLDDIVTTFLQRPKADITDMFDYLYETLPKQFQFQRDELVGEHG